MLKNSFGRLAGIAAGSVASLALAAQALAQEAAPAAAAAPPPTLSAGDTAWMLISTALVLMMTLPGLALFYGGMVRKKNVLSILMQCFSVAALCSVLWVIVGYSLAFTEGSPFIGGLDRMFMGGMSVDELAGRTFPESVFAMFQLTFAVITPALITGAFADRMKFSAFMIFSAVWLMVVYVPIAHMVWGPKGFLLDAGVLDFAGGTVVHINAGVAGLVAALVIGKRRNISTENMAPHNLVLTMIGASLLWIGWFGFNAGSATAANGLAGMAMLTTHSATAIAALAWTFAEWVLKGKPSLLGAASGAVAGLVAITPACGYVDLKGALVIGAASGLICYWGVTGLKRLGGWDDALDCFGVHGVGGLLGAVLTGVFALKSINPAGADGLLAGNPGLVVTQLMGIGITIVWSAIATFIILKLVDVAVGLRVSDEHEVEGLDYVLHGETMH